MARLTEGVVDTFKVSRRMNKQRKIVEVYITPPSFLLYLWACFPLLLLATADNKAAIIGAVATTINFLLIHFDTFRTMRYILAGIVTFTAIGLYGQGII